MSGILAQAWLSPRDTQPKASGRRSPREMSPSALQGMLLAAAAAIVLLAVAAASISDGVAALFGLGGLVIVVGGVTASAFLTFRSEDVVAALRSVIAPDIAAAEDNIDLRKDMADIVGWARVVCGQGLRALEHSTADRDTRDAFVTYGLTLVVCDYAPEDVQAMLHIAAEGIHERECRKVDVLATMAGHAPAFGMVGTLIGMISLLQDIAGETGAIGGMLGVAFLSTLYGILSARMIYMPAAARLERQVEARRLRNSMVTEGMVMLAGRKSGMVIRDRLRAYLHPEAHTGFDVVGEAPTIAPDAGYRHQGTMRAIPHRSLTMVKG